MKRNFAFLASTLQDSGFVALRKALHQAGKNAEKPIWVAEIDDEQLRHDLGLTPLDIIDHCLDQIDASERFFLLVGDGFGSSIEFAGKSLPSSFTELELFYAVVREKPITLLFVESANVGGELATMIEALRFGIGGRKIVGRDAIINYVERALNEPEPTRAPRRDDKRRLSGALAIERHLDPTNGALFREMEFLDGRAVQIGRPRGDLDLVRACLDDLRRQSRTDRRMSRAWLALRELMGSHYATTKDPEALRLWREALRAWSQFAGWKGMHAHLYLGHIAALGALAKVVERQGDSALRTTGDAHGDNLSGAFASAYYSLSKISPYRMTSNFLERSQAYVQHGLKHGDDAAQSGLLALRGSILLRRGRVGGAREDYEKALMLAEASASNAAKVGELKVELALAELLSGRFRTARRRAEEGATMLAEAGAGAGFRARALRKLACIRAATAAPIGAYRAALDAGRLVQDAKLEDQRDAAISVAHAVERGLKKLSLDGGSGA